MIFMPSMWTVMMILEAFDIYIYIQSVNRCVNKMMPLCNGQDVIMMAKISRWLQRYSK